jgi:hypothetical protein
MSDHGNEFDELAGQLIDLHLGRLEPDEAARLASRLAASPEARLQSERCAELLKELDAFEAPAPSDLAERVLSRIGATERVIPFPEIESVSAAAGGDEGSRSPLFSLRELVVIAACITLFVGIFIPGYYKAQAISKKNLCRQHLAQIYGGLSAYQQANAGFLPFAGAVPGGSWLQVRTPGVLRASNTRHIYLTVRDGYITNTEVFLCPGQDQGVRMVMDNYRRVDDFAEPGNIGYSVQNNNSPRPAATPRLSNRMVYVGDANPFFAGRMAHVLDPSGVENSSSHEANAGQNVLALDGQVAWVTRPTVGVAGDHIYQAGTLKRYVGTELPQGPTDTFLVP